MLRVTSTLILALSLWVAFLPAPQAGAQSPDRTPPKIGITAITFSAEIQAVVDGLRDRLAERNFRPGQTIEFLIRDSTADTARAAEVVR